MAVYGNTPNDLIKRYQESAEHVKADKVENGEAAAAGSLLAGVVVWLQIAKFSWQAGQHDLLPGLSCGAPITAWRKTSASERKSRVFFTSRLKRDSPEEHQDGLRKGLKVVVAIDLRSVHHGYFSENLKTQINSTNFLLSHKSERHWRQQGVWLQFELEEAITCIPITA